MTVINNIDPKNINVNPSGKGVFGFSNFAETWNGRMAMIGFVAGLTSEVITGKGILAQVGITNTAGGYLVALFLAGFTVAAIVGYYAVKLSSPVQVPQEESSTIV
jgi:hypothetical protein